MFGHGYFGAGYYGPGYWGPGVGTPPPVVDDDDTHDGFDKERKRRDKAFRSARERLRETIALAYDPEHGKVEVQALAEPYVERLESGAPRIDYAALERNAAVMAEILAFQASLRAEFEARVAAYEQDEEDVMILLWN